MTAKEKKELIAWVKKIYSEVDDDEIVPIFVEELFGLAALRSERKLAGEYKKAMRAANKMSRFLAIQSKVIEKGIKDFRKFLC